MFPKGRGAVLRPFSCLQTAFPECGIVTAGGDALASEVMGIREWLIGGAMLWVTLSPGAAHDSLYHYLEVTTPRDGGPVEIAFSVHAADLGSARALGADPAGTDLTWLQGRTAAELAPVLEEARRFLEETFSLLRQATAIDLGEAARFPESGVLAAGIEAARPGFLVASLTLPDGTPEILLQHRPTSGKRLLVVVNRPGAFPAVRDLAPGDSTTLVFPRS